MGLFREKEPMTCPLCSQPIHGNALAFRDGEVCEDCIRKAGLSPTNVVLLKEMRLADQRDRSTETARHEPPAERPSARPETCPLCGKKQPIIPWKVQDGYICTECYGKVSTHISRSETEQLPTAALAELLRRVEEWRDETDCGCCGKNLLHPAEIPVFLKDGTKVCASCARKVRILYPTAFEQKQSGKTQLVILDSLLTLTLEQFKDALPRAAEATTSLLEAFDDSKAMFEVKGLMKTAMEDGGHERTFVWGTVKLGSIQAGDRMQVKRNEGVKSFSILSVQWYLGSTNVPAPSEIEALAIGEQGILELSMADASVYPGDVIYKS